MKLKNLIAFISFTAFTTLVSSCGDSYMPITLVSLDEKTTVTNNDTISLVKFSEGEQYKIKGGDGYYFVKTTNKESSDKKVVRHQQEDNLLSLLPENEGISYLTIKDSEKNEARVVLVVEKIDKYYNVESHNIIIEGNKDFTFGQKDEITRKITENALVKVGGRFEFQYTNSTSGVAKIKPDENANYITGTFTQEVIFNPQNGEKILSLKVSLPGNDTFDLSLSESNMTISQDLTDEYKPQYSNLGKAVLEYKLSQIEEGNNNAK